MLHEFLSSANLRGLAEISRPTLRWRHPGGRYIEKVVDAAFCTDGAWAWTIDGEPKRNDRNIVILQRRGRKAFQPRRATDSRP